MITTLAKPCLFTFAKNLSVVHKFLKDSGLKSASVPDIVGADVFSDHVIAVLENLAAEDGLEDATSVLQDLPQRYKEQIQDASVCEWALELLILLVKNSQVQRVEDIGIALKSVKVVEQNADKGDLFESYCAGDVLLLRESGALRSSRSMPHVEYGDRSASVHVCTRALETELLGDDYDCDDTHSAARIAQGIHWLPGHGYTEGSLSSGSEQSYLSGEPCLPDALPSLLLPAQLSGSEFTYSELFSGIGGFGVALRALGGRCAFAVEFERHAQLTYLLNHSGTVSFSTPDSLRKILDTQPHTPILFNDVTMLQDKMVPTHDVLTAGFPCQPFSRLGAQPGLHDATKGKLILHVLRIARVSQPKILLLENVLGLQTLNSGCVMAAVLRAISRIGYCVSYQVVDSVALCPQYRKRVYITAVRADLVQPTVTFPLYKLPDLGRTVWDILDHEVSDSHLLPPARWQHVQHLGLLRLKGSWKLARPFDPAGTLVTSYKRGVYYNSQFVPVYNKDGGQRACVLGEAPEETLRTQAGSMQWYPFDAALPAVMPWPETVRFYTVRECQKLMGFPNTFAFAETERAYAQLGNAVCPPIIALVAASALQYVNALKPQPVSALMVPVELAIRQTAQALGSEEKARVLQKLHELLVCNKE